MIQLETMYVSALAMLMVSAIECNVCATSIQTGTLEESAIDSQKFQIEEKDGEVILKKYTGNDRSVFIPKNITVIGTNCFKGCCDLERVTFEAGSSLKRIEDRAFYDCGSLREIEIPSNVEVIGKNCFKMCRSLYKVKFAAPSRLKVIGSMAFHLCDKLQDIKIPSSVQVVAKGGFARCYLLSEVTFLPASASEPVFIGSDVFFRCDKLAEVTGLPAEVKHLDNTIAKLTGRKKEDIINLPAEVKNLGITIDDFIWLTK